MEQKVREIGSRSVKITDAFWSKIQQKVIDVVIPFQEKVLNDEIPNVEKSHAIENFRIAAGLSEGEFYGMVFQDSDVATWLEGVAYSLIVKPDEALETRADEIIGIIEKAQQPDGYLDTYFIIKEPEHRWQNLHECHELYCAGHMMEAAAAYYEATGKDKLLHVTERLADAIINRFGSEEGKEHGIPGHQEVEIGLMRLYHVTGKEKYKHMARYFLEERGKNPDYFYEEKVKRGWQHWGQYSLDKLDVTYNQAHRTIYEQNEAVGHAVRALYMYTAMADLAGTDADERLYQACRTLWDNIIQKKLYITGGLGGNSEGEAFGPAYELPNDMAYAETCASIAMVFFAHHMLEMDMDGAYADIIEKELYNSTISGMQLDGEKYFYVNPLECEPGVSGKLFGYRHALPVRPGWYACACCPPNLIRLVTSLGKYCFSESASTVYSHLMIGQIAQTQKAKITVETSYPWEGHAVYTVEPKTDKVFTLAVHIPYFVDFTKEGAYLSVNGETIPAAELSIMMKKGYVYLTRTWQAKDQVVLHFPMEVRKVYANQHVRENAGCVALMRGPVVYCVEGADNGDLLQSLRIPKNLKAEAYLCEDGILKGNVLLLMDGYRMAGSGELYSEKPPVKEKVSLTAVPYCIWANRGENQMRVWMLEEF